MEMILITLIIIFMSTKIEWCTETWNPIVGCTKVSPGCDHCYAERMANRLKSMSEKYDGKGKNIFHRSATGKYSHVISEKGKWNGKTHFDEADFKKPSRWKKSRMIFVCSMGDLFHESISDELIDEIFLAMRFYYRRHLFLILTKRPERMHAYYRGMAKGGDVEPLPNLWLGVTAENQAQANKRVPILLSIPAAKRFVSVEPMLTQVDLVNCYGDTPWTPGTRQLGFIDWVICGGESGPGARPMHPEWVRFLQSECHCAGVPFFFKQWGEWLPSYDFGERLEEMVKNFPKCIIRKRHEFPDGINMYKVGKKAAGSLLDGKEYKQYPK
jgi:protein gp37